MPVIASTLTSSPTRQYNGYQDSIVASFRNNDQFEIAPPSAVPQYKGEDTFLTLQFIEQAGINNAEIYTTRLDFVDYDTGKFSTYAPWENTKPSRTVRFELDTAESIWEFKQWLYRRAGRLRPLWVPTHEEDFRLIDTGVLNTSVRVKNDGQFTFARDRVDVGFLLKDGTWLLREIHQMVPDGNDLVLDVDELGGIKVQDMDVLCYLDRRRLASDRIELTWPSVNRVNASVSMVIVE